MEEFLKQHGFSNIHGDRRPTLARKGSFKNLLRMSPKLGPGGWRVKGILRKKNAVWCCFSWSFTNFESFSLLVILGVGDAKMFWKLDGSWKVYTLPESSSSP